MPLILVLLSLQLSYPYTAVCSGKTCVYSLPPTSLASLLVTLFSLILPLESYQGRERGELWVSLVCLETEAIQSQYNKFVRSV